MPASGRKVFFQFQFEGVNIDKASKSGKTDAYLEMAVSTENPDEFVTIHRTEVIKKTTDPQWEKFQLTINQLKSRFLRCDQFNSHAVEVRYCLSCRYCL